ncbi:MAG: hypothetical protein CMI27_05420 [Opitutae bacterium]|nr:hypothetical protein [Opitutae bacterium]
MSLWGIILRNLVYFKKQHFGVAAGSALCAMVLMGALTVGDSVRSTLSSLAEERIGKGDLAMLSPDGFFEEDLAERIYDRLLDKDIVAAPLVLTRGILTTPNGSLKVSNIQVLGVDERFWQLAPDPKHAPTGGVAQKKTFPLWDSDVFLINDRLNSRLKAREGTRLILRMEEPSLFSRDAPLSGERDNKFVTLNQELGPVVSARGFGNFGLQGNQREPLTIFVSLQALQKKLFRSLDEVAGNTRFANFLLLGHRSNGEVDSTAAKKAVDLSWRLEDAGIEIKELRESKEWSLRTRQVFLSDGLVEQARKSIGETSGVLTYLVNAIEKKSDSNKSALIPYSMISAIEPKKVDFLGDDWKDDFLALNEWAASDLNVSVGDSIQLSFYTVGERRKLIESSRIFELRKILSMPSPVPQEEESDWTPRFPGLSDADSCGEWDTGIPIVHQVRDIDEDYWNEFRGSPKGFVSLRAGQQMWGNLWGSLTGLRVDREKFDKEEIALELRKNLSAEEAGLVMRAIRSDANESVESPVDFGQLFLSFSFFVVIAALALTGMLFSFSIQQRSQQAGLLLGLGWTRRKVRILFLGEGILVALLGSIGGGGLAVLYGNSILNLLGGKWSGAVSGTSFSYSPSFESILTGGGGAVVMAAMAMIWATRKQFRKEPRELLTNAETEGGSKTTSTKTHLIYKWLSLFLSIGAFMVAVSTDLTTSGASGAFFGAGSLLLAAGLFYFRARLFSLADKKQSVERVEELFRRNSGRRAGRSMVTVGAMAAGSFLVVSTGAFRKQSLSTPHTKESATGGFSYVGESAVPIYDDLNTEEGQGLHGLEANFLENTKVVPLRVREGDDASCLNLNKAVRPHIYGVKLSEFEDRFSFAEGNWADLQGMKEEAIPALVDQNTLLWALKKGVGDRLQFVDGRGQPFEVELVAVVKGSILQGALYIDEELFLEKFPQQGGYRAFFLEGGSDAENSSVNHLEDRLSNYGIEFQSTLERLDNLQKVENTYLSIFQGLGGLGLLLGTAGLAVVVARNLIERGREYGLLEALGYDLPSLRSLARKEYLQLALWGVGIGSISALVGIAPALLGTAGEMPGKEFASFFVLLLSLGIFWTWASVYMNLRTSRLFLLRDE